MTSRLKSLELHGYKTFASRVVFEFPGQITAIVGPNGSGKSNIADSIRWVLGEQSFSLLRGRKTEDMIFAGSEQRPRAGMAVASITFDNEDGWLPIDFSEVSIARRAYRDGQNEYVLNGQRVRLKEISELLAQSGLAERTYTMIGQGLVDAALSLKPEERRRFFEEAAGIGLYRSRREESLNRLETTRRNLERVQDILSELEPRLRSLEKQAARAIEYERIKADLRILLRDWYGFHWHRTQKDVAHAREVLQIQENRLEKTRQTYEEVENRVKAQRINMQSVRAKLNDWHTQSAELHNQREKVSRSLAVMDERQRALQDQIANWNSDLARLEEEEKSHRERFENIEIELDRLSSDQAEAQAQVQEVQKKLNQRMAERGQAESQLRELRRQLVRGETRQVEIKAHQGELDNRLEMLRKNKTNLEQGVASTEQVEAQAKIRLDAVKVQRQALEDERAGFENDLHAAQLKVSEAEQSRKKLQDQLTQLSGSQARLKAQLEVLEQAERTLSGLNQGSKTIIQAAQQGKLKGSFRALSSMLEVPTEYEVAIAAVLGEFLDGIAVDNKTSLDAVFEVLEKGDKGRAVLYPLEWLRDEPAAKMVDDPDFVGTASSLVKFNEEIRPLVNAILAQVLVVKNREAARRVVAKQPSGFRVVTLRGEVFLSNGAVIAGQEGRTNLIARPRQKRELQEALESAGADLEKLQSDLRSLGLEVDRLRKTQQEKEQQIRQCVQKVNQAGQAVQQASLEWEQARQKREWQHGQIQSLVEQLQKSEQELARQKAEFRKTAEENEKNSLAVREAQKLLDKLPVEEFQTQLVHWNTQTAVISRSVRDTENRADEYRQALRNNKNQQSTLQQRLSSAEASLASLLEEKNEQHNQEASLNGSIEELRALIEPAEAELNMLEKQYEQVQGELTSAQQTVAVAERHMTQAQLELGRYRENLESLRRRIEEDFGLVAFEYASDISGPTPLPLDGMVEQLPVVVEIPQELEDNINRQKSQLRRMGPINQEAQHEYRSVKDRHAFMTTQVADLKRADEDLRQVIAELDALMKIEFRKTFDAVAAEFRHMFTRLFGGGSARLILHDEDHPTESGIEIEAKLPGRREQGLSLLSGGERSLTAVALIFSLLKVSPTPFCVMDEVDAMLDEANVGRFCELLKELSENTQFIVITHNRNTVQVADVIYGITMGKDSASQMISLKLDEVSEEMVK